jgi:hypothetical protein
LLVAKDQGGSMSEAVVAASAAICIALPVRCCRTPAPADSSAKARLDRLNAQLQAFYGPRYALLQANHIAHLRAGHMDQAIQRSRDSRRVVEKRRGGRRFSAGR